MRTRGRVVWRALRRWREALGRAIGGSLTVEPIVVQTEEQIEALRDACAGMGIKRGRASRYARLLEESLVGACSEEHVLAAYESSEIVELWTLWKRHAAGCSASIRVRQHAFSS